MRLLLLIFGLLSEAFADTGAIEKFHQLRENHSGSIAAPYFKAEMDQKSAKLLLKNKIKGTYKVQVVYDRDYGISLLVKDTEPFYENILSSYATYANTMLLPLLSTSTYTRLQKRMQITHPEDRYYELSFPKGDILVLYQFWEGDNGLVDRIVYQENGKKLYTMVISWKKIESVYVPNSFKSTVHERSRRALSFELKNIIIKSQLF